MSILEKLGLRKKQPLKFNPHKLAQMQQAIKQIIEYHLLLVNSPDYAHRKYKRHMLHKCNKIADKLDLSPVERREVEKFAFESIAKLSRGITTPGVNVNLKDSDNDLDGKRLVASNPAP